jgi:hypothetical protein
MEMGVVSGINKERPHQPTVKVISDSMGIPLPDPRTLDLSQTDPATQAPVRTIIKTTDAEKYGINVSDYLI